uniref:Uncharacterized protein n=1 Tax=Setaria italica TaxID=4555 RepID=K3ZAZ2_SETIT
MTITSITAPDTKKNKSPQASRLQPCISSQTPTNPRQRKLTRNLHTKLEARQLVRSCYPNGSETTQQRIPKPKLQKRTTNFQIRSHAPGTDDNPQLSERGSKLHPSPNA